MSHDVSAKSRRQAPRVELRTGTPYANLIANQRLFAAVVGEYFGVSPDDCIPTTGATGAIEAVRNHVFRTRLKAYPTVLTVRPGYWRARESFEGFGFEMIDLHTEPVGSTSKSHGTAEYRIGWAVCANSEDADRLRKENRSGIASVSIMEAIKRLERGSTVMGPIESSFALLRDGEKWGGFELVTPERMAETGYVLIRARAGAEELRSVFDRHGIFVMWGSEFGLTDEYIRLETLEPRNIKIFVEAVNNLPHEKTVGPVSKTSRD